MKKYKVVITATAKDDLRKYIAYVREKLKSPKAARNIADDFRETKQILSELADSIREPDSNRLKIKNLKRMNFQRHDYFMLFRISGNIVEITNIFHTLEDYENKLY